MDGRTPDGSAVLEDYSSEIPFLENAIQGTIDYPTHHYVDLTREQLSAQRLAQRERLNRWREKRDQREHELFWASIFFAISLASITAWFSNVDGTRDRVDRLLLACALFSLVAFLAFYIKARHVRTEAQAVYVQLEATIFDDPTASRGRTDA